MSPVQPRTVSRESRAAPGTPRLQTRAEAAPPGHLPARLPAPGALPPAQVLRLQRLVGNQAVTRLLGHGAKPGRHAHLQRFYDPARVQNQMGAALRYIQDSRANLLKDYQNALEAIDPDYRKQSAVLRTPHLQALANHAAVFQALKAEAGLPDAIAGAYNHVEVADVIRILNAIEDETRTLRTASRQTSHNYEDAAFDIRIGTEFTFSHGKLLGMKVGQGSEENARTFVEAWVEYVRQTSPYKPVVAPATGAKSQMARTFTYELKGQGQWSWTLDLDDSCLETQTQPSSLPELKSGAIAVILQKDLFGGAEAAGVRPDPTPSGGGGHISLDAGLTFGGSAELFLTTLYELQNGYRTWQEYFADEDLLNAPWAAELEKNGGPALDSLNERVEALLVRVHAGELDLDGAVGEIQKFNKEIRNPMAEELRKSKIQTQKEAGQNVADHPDHYQAINVEHLRDPGGAARIEFRRIPAQLDFGKFHEDVQTIFQLITEIRGAVLKAVERRLG